MRVGVDMQTPPGFDALTPRSLCPREISEEVEDERVGFVRRFQRDEMCGTSDFDVAGVR